MINLKFKIYRVTPKVQFGKQNIQIPHTHIILKHITSFSPKCLSYSFTLHIYRKVLQTNNFSY